MTSNEEYREKKKHGKAEFPFDIYCCTIPDVIPEVLTHWHEEMELIYIRKGRGWVTVDEESREIEGPAVVFVFPGHLHSIRCSYPDRLEYRNILFHPELLYSKAGEITDWEYLRPFFEGVYNIPVFLDASNPEFEALTAPLEACGELEQDMELGYPLFVKSQLFLFCYQIIRRYPDKNAERVRRETQGRIKPVLSYLMEMYSEDISVADAAAVAGFSEAHFMRFFRETMGVSFVTYLRDYRLSRAEEMIRTTDRSILAVAQDTGFGNLSYFIRHFKIKYGLTPLRYRKVKGVPQ